MGILDGWAEPGPEPDTAALTAAVARAGATDWRAAAWLLEHHPSTSNTYSDAAARTRIRASVIADCIAAINATGLPRDLERTLLLQMIAHGLGNEWPPDGGGDHGGG